MSYITIYFGDKPVFLCDKLNPEIEEIRHHPDAVFIDEFSTAAINSLLHEIDKPQFHAGIILHGDLEKLKKQFFKHFKVIKAGGGLVKNKKDELLLIFRRGKWDLPKGKLDDNETILECAIREVKEETGLSKIKAGKKIETTYHTYNEFGKHILKESHWYSMTTNGEEKLVPQIEESITEIRWVKKDEMTRYLDNTFPTIISLLKNA
jgi:8-oxo-dGTP pyrophosphatase MutT (NUDIX family)